MILKKKFILTFVRLIEINQYFVVRRQLFLIGSKIQTLLTKVRLNGYLYPNRAETNKIFSIILIIVFYRVSSVFRIGEVQMDEQKHDRKIIIL